MCSQTTCEDSCNAISSPASADGLSRCGSQDGQRIVQCGQEAALASRLASPASGKDFPTSATFGRPGGTSSASGALQNSLESRLVERLGSAGSMELRAIWRAKTTRLGRRYCQRVPLMRPIDGTDSGSWRTPSGTNHRSHGVGAIGEWGGASNPYRGTDLANVHCPSFELWMMGYPAEWAQLMPPAMPSSRKSRRK